MMGGFVIDISSVRHHNMSITKQWGQQLNVSTVKKIFPWWVDSPMENSFLTTDNRDYRNSNSLSNSLNTKNSSLLALFESLVYFNTFVAMPHYLHTWWKQPKIP